MLKYFTHVKSSDGILYLDVACTVLTDNKQRQYHNGTRCMLLHVNKITDVDSSLFFINIKCKLPFGLRTRTTHGDGRTTTKTKKYQIQ